MPFAHRHKLPGTFALMAQLKPERSGIPEYRNSVMAGVGLDLSRDDVLMHPLEHLDSEERDSSPGESKEPEAQDPALRLSNVIRALVGPGSRVLLFEPTRPDLRQAILDNDASYIDGGRLLQGAMDPSVLEYFRGEEPDLVVIERDDVAPEGFSVPFLVDARSAPYQKSRLPGRRHFALHALGPRDGFSDILGVWLEAPGHDEGAPPSLVRAALAAPGFEERSAQRQENELKSLEHLKALAVEAGFESRCRAGYLWLGLPGFASTDIERAFRDAGLGVLGCSHHPYRQRVRLAPPDLQTIAGLTLIFSLAYKNLTSCD